ncbi:MAG: lipopolysaccharide transport periplasmic protein LptA [Lautropia sp.]|nr:lipopolysaccharide transport periplasmic protein LptA [Lautropia sp.]
MTRTRLAVWIALALFCLPVQAERADREKPTNIEADKLEYDDARQITVFTGHVLLTKGTIVIRGDRLVLRQFSEGMQTAVATGKRASFRQKREGMEQIINGFANQIEYDSRSETLKLTSDALIKRLECDVAIDEITGGVIVYNAQSELFTVDGKAPGDASGRVRIIIQPRADTKSEAGTGAAKCPPGTPVPLKPAASLASPRGTAAASR